MDFGGCDSVYCYMLLVGWCTIKIGYLVGLTCNVDT